MESKSSFHGLDDEEFEIHLRIDRYNNFLLTGAIRPSYDLQIVPQAGYLYDTGRLVRTKDEIPVLVASVSAEIIFDVFLDLIDEFSNSVVPRAKVILQTSHDSSSASEQPEFSNIDCGYHDLAVLKKHPH